MTSQRDRDIRRDENVRRAREYMYGPGKAWTMPIVLAALVGLGLGLLFSSDWNEWTKPGVSERTRVPTAAPPATDATGPSRQ